MTAAVLHDLPMPARLAPWPQASRTTLVRCLWLAGLLHVWALLWLGSAPEGTAPAGQGVAGRLNVTLRGPSDEGLPSAPPPQVGPALAADPAAAPRIGGRVRETPLPPEALPGSERLGPTPVLPAPLPSPAAAQPSLAPPAPAVAPALPDLAPLLVAPPTEGRLDAGSLRALVPTPAAPLAPPAPVAMPVVPDTRVPALGAALGAAVTAPSTSAATTASTATTATPEPTAAARAAPAADDTSPRLGADLAVPATAASAPKRLNLELGRLRGGELSRHGSAGVLPVLPRPPETDKLAGEIEKAARTDCTKAYASAGILAVVPLAVDAVRGKGCKW